MPIVTQGMYRLELFQDYYGQECINTFFYRHTTGDNTLADTLAVLWDATNINLFRAIQSANLSYTNIRCTPIFGTGVEYNLTPGQGAGSVVGNDLPPYVAISIKLLRGTNETRNGWKRITGMIEENMGALGWGGTFYSTVVTLANSLAANVTDGVDTFEPVVARKPFSTKEQLPNWYYAPIDGSFVPNRPTTQSSRKTF